MYNRDINQLLKEYLLNTETKCLFFNTKIETLNDTIESLRDTNLDLEIDNFSSNQDLAILESRLLKYQQKFNFNEECGSFKSELAKLLKENKSQISANASLQQQLMCLTSELQEMQEIANEAKDLQLILQRANEEMQNQADLAQQQIVYKAKPTNKVQVAPLDCRCIQSDGQVTGNRTRVVPSEKCASLNQLQAAKFQQATVSSVDAYAVCPLANVDSSQNQLCRSTLETYDNVDPQDIMAIKVSIDRKQLELDQFEELLHETQEKLDFSLEQNEQLRNELQLLICQIRGHQNQSSTEDDCTLCCDLYRENLCELKEKFTKVRELLSERNKQFNHLEAKFKEQCGVNACLRRQLQGTRLQYEGEIASLQQTNTVLEEKLRNYEKNSKCLQEEAIRNQALLMESNKRESKLEQELLCNEKQLSDKSRSIHSKEERLCLCIVSLEKENDSIRQDANSAYRDLELAKCQCSAMKKDVHQIVQEQNTLKLQNEQLHACLATAQASSMKFEQKCKCTAQDLKQCSRELTALRDERNCLEEINKKLNEEFKVLNTEYAALNRDYEQISESVTNLESELSNSKVNQKELCLESQNIVNNVRAWLKDQTIAKDNITHKIKLDQSLIYKLQQQIAKLNEFYKTCKCGAFRQRGGGNPVIKKRHKQKFLWSLGSQGTSSLVSEFSNNPEWSPREDIEEDSYTDEDSSNSWLHKVEGLTKEIKKSNRYWKSKILDDHMVTKDK